ncbi:hypothetical protein [Streptomyces sp. NPDC003077]|uniref:hypothetical protein n=1 Tax=Streptomyces sp. NPDC003077 TaxID=3154443 RepID=UPI0033A23EB4
MSRRQVVEGENVVFLSRSWLCVCFALQWLVLPLDLAWRLAWNVFVTLGDGAMSDLVEVSSIARRSIGLKRFAREWNRDPRRWEAHYRAVLTEIGKETHEQDFSFRVRLRYVAQRAPADKENPQRVFCTIFIPHYRGCGPTKAQRIARANGWTVFSTSAYGIMLFRPDPKWHDAAHSEKPTGSPR